MREEMNNIAMSRWIKGNSCALLRIHMRWHRIVHLVRRIRAEDHGTSTTPKKQIRKMNSIRVTYNRRVDWLEQMHVATAEQPRALPAHMRLAAGGVKLWREGNSKKTWS